MPIKFFLLLLIFSTYSFSQDKKAESKTQLEKEVEAVDFNKLQDVLKEDDLMKNVVNKKKIVKKIQKQRIVDQSFKYQWPDKNDIWKIMSELWLVKNAVMLKWDTTHPDYGIEDNFRNTLEAIGLFERKIKILYTKNPDVTHVALPSDRNEYILVLSIPFIRTMDLTKREISMLLLEDILRIEAGYLKKNLSVDLSWLGSNFEKSGFDAKKVNDLLKGYSDVLLEKGYSFQQQFELTKKVDQMLKSHPILWNSYMSLLKKIDNLVKNNLMFKSYLKIYPSPEMQIKWITPKI